MGFRALWLEFRSETGFLSTFTAQSVRIFIAHQMTLFSFGVSVWVRVSVPHKTRTVRACVLSAVRLVKESYPGDPQKRRAQQPFQGPGPPLIRASSVQVFICSSAHARAVLRARAGPTWESERSSSVARARFKARGERGARRSMASGEMVGSRSVRSPLPDRGRRAIGRVDAQVECRRRLQRRPDGHGSKVPSKKTARNSALRYTL